MSEEQKIKILICDDHPIMRFGIAAIIQSQPNMMVAAQAGTAAEAVRLNEILWQDQKGDAPAPATKHAIFPAGGN